MRDARLGDRHLLGDLAPKPDDLDVFDAVVAGKTRCLRDLRSARQEGIDVLMAYAAGRTTAGDLAQIDAGLSCPEPDGGRRQRFLALWTRRAGDRDLSRCFRTGRRWRRFCLRLVSLR
ncbi:hypothetical protein AJ88_01050 [Mesorhizobium amorphae CCBAU 01583]|nr:hypothetical protein AJ88_01050 [Mesorhizobium amorphae CCBAU 01583]